MVRALREVASKTMERRKDHRHNLSYTVSIKCPRTQRVLDGLATERVSASGLSFRSTVPHGLNEGDLVELQLIADVSGKTRDDVLVMATQATVVRVNRMGGALEFAAPLAY